MGGEVAAHPGGCAGHLAHVLSTPAGMGGGGGARPGRARSAGHGNAGRSRTPRRPRPKLPIPSGMAIAFTHLNFLEPARWDVIRSYLACEGRHRCSIMGLAGLATADWKKGGLVACGACVASQPMHPSTWRASFGGDSVYPFFTQRRGNGGGYCCACGRAQRRAGGGAGYSRDPGHQRHSCWWRRRA